MPKCDPRAFARCPYKATCAPIEEATFMEGSDCDLYNQKVLRTPLTKHHHPVMQRTRLHRLPHRRGQLPGAAAMAEIT